MGAGSVNRRLHFGDRGGQLPDCFTPIGAERNQ
jgi:hypothetical protein